MDLDFNSRAHVADTPAERITIHGDDSPAGIMALADAGAHVVLTSRSEPELQSAASEIASRGGSAGVVTGGAPRRRRPPGMWVATTRRRR